MKMIFYVLILTFLKYCLLDDPRYLPLIQDENNGNLYLNATITLGTSQVAYLFLINTFSGYTTVYATEDEFKNNNKNYSDVTLNYTKSNQKMSFYETEITIDDTKELKNIKQIVGVDTEKKTSGKYGELGLARSYFSDNNHQSFYFLQKFTTQFSITQNSEGKYVLTLGSVLPTSDNFKTCYMYQNTENEVSYFWAFKQTSLIQGNGDSQDNKKDMEIPAIIDSTEAGIIYPDNMTSTFISFMPNCNQKTDTATNIITINCPKESDRKEFSFGFRGAGLNLKVDTLYTKNNDNSYDFIIRFDPKAKYITYGKIMFKYFNVVFNNAEDSVSFVSIDTTKSTTFDIRNKYIYIYIICIFVGLFIMIVIAGAFIYRNTQSQKTTTAQNVENVGNESLI